MAPKRRTLKRHLKHMTGFRFKPGILLDSEGDSVMVACRLLNMHPSRDPYTVLDEETVHEKLLELMENCHAERDLMFNSTRMEPLLWQKVQSATSWAHYIPTSIIRTLALELTQAADANYQDPKCNSHGIELPFCRLAVASLRFATDIFIDEADRWNEDDLIRTDFVEFRGPAYLQNGKQCLDSNGQPVTIPVFPIDCVGGVWRPRGRSCLFAATEEEPYPMVDGWIKRV